MKRGRKAKPPGNCLECNKFTKVWTRKFCRNCYVRLLNNNKILKIVKLDCPEFLTSIQQQVLFGHMLGDGCLFKSKKSHKAHFSLARKNTDLEYMKYSFSIFKSFISSEIKKYEIFDKRTNKKYYGIKFITRKCKILDQIYNTWYPNGKKIIPKTLELTPLTLAIWFLDDGYIRNTCSKHRFQIKLSTMGFTNEDVDLLVNLLNIKFNNTFIAYEENGKKFISAADEGTRLFIKEIDDFIPVGMERKICWRNEHSRIYQNEPKTYKRFKNKIS